MDVATKTTMEWPLLNQKKVVSEDVAAKYPGDSCAFRKPWKKRLTLLPSSLLMLQKFRFQELGYTKTTPNIYG